MQAASAADRTPRARPTKQGRFIFIFGFILLQAVDYMEKTVTQT
jgi:hypothetical protein